MSTFLLFASVVLGVITLGSTLYLVGSDLLLRFWNRLAARDPKMERTMKTVTVEFSSDTFPVLQAQPSEDPDRSALSSPSPDLAQTEAVTVVAPYASRVIELNDEDGSPTVWLCTLCLN
jgi:hypothetical protein